jgi:dihydrolipoamide dehydrogenase
MATISLEQVARASLTEHQLGFYRMVIDRQSDQILGATLVGPQAGELAQIFLAHMEAGSSWHVLEESMHVHPTYAEGLPVLARQFCE